MPVPGYSHTRRPLLWLHGEVDVRDLRSTVIFHRGGGGNVSFPAFDLDADEGLYEDVLALAHGRGSTAAAASVNNRRDMTSDWQAQHPDGFGEGGVRITAGDCVQLWASAVFDLEASADNAVFGLPTAGATAVLDILSNEYRITGTTEWTRGPVEDAHLTITPDVGDAFQVPRYAYHAQGVIELIRRRGRTLTEVMGEYEAGAYDADDAYSGVTLEDLDNAVNDATLRRIRHYIDLTGHYCIAWPNAVSLNLPIFDSTALRDLLGATGTLAADSDIPQDTIETVGDVRVWRAARAITRATYPSRPWIKRPTRVGGEEGEAERLIEGGAAAAPVSQWEDLEFSFWVDGPESPNVDDDLSAHLNRRFLAGVPRGARLTIYAGLDTRRHQEIDEVANGQPSHSDLYTSDRCGGRWYGWVRSPDDPAEVTVEFDEDQGGEFWARATMRIAPPRRE